MFTVIIPARYQSRRLPGKALIEIAGKPMVQHVYERACKSDASSVVVATDDERIAGAVTGFGGTVCMTSAHHPSGTDRLQEAAHKLGLGANDVVVNVQGDEPLVPPEVINQVATNLLSSGLRMATLFEPIATQEDVQDPNIVKVVVGIDGRALYFSRAAIPHDRDGDSDPAATSYKRHLGIYAYRVSLLDEFVGFQPGELEKAERLEQLRVLAHGIDIHVAASVVPIPPGVDTERDLARTIAALEER